MQKKKKTRKHIHSVCAHIHKSMFCELKSTKRERERETVASNKEPTIKCSCKPFGLVFGSFVVLFLFTYTFGRRRFILIIHNRKTPYEFHDIVWFTLVSLSIYLARGLFHIHTQTLTHFQFGSLFIKYQIGYLYFWLFFFSAVFSVCLCMYLCKLCAIGVTLELCECVLLIRWMFVLVLLLCVIVVFRHHFFWNCSFLCCSGGDGVCVCQWCRYRQHSSHHRRRKSNHSKRSKEFIGLPSISVYYLHVVYAASRFPFSILPLFIHCHRITLFFVLNFFDYWNSLMLHSKSRSYGVIVYRGQDSKRRHTFPRARTHTHIQRICIASLYRTHLDHHTLHFAVHINLIFRKISING